MTVRLAAGARASPLLRGVEAPFESKGSLYKTSPLANTATPLLLGKAGDHPEEPVAWTNAPEGGGRVLHVAGTPGRLRRARVSHASAQRHHLGARRPRTTGRETDAGRVQHHRPRRHRRRQDARHRRRPEGDRRTLTPPAAGRSSCPRARTSSARSSSEGQRHAAPRRQAPSSSAPPTCRSTRTSTRSRTASAPTSAPRSSPSIDAKNVTIEGKGTFNGNGKAVAAAKRFKGEGWGFRPMLLRVVRCSDVSVRGRHVPRLGLVDHQLLPVQRRHDRERHDRQPRRPAQRRHQHRLLRGLHDHQLRRRQRRRRAGPEVHQRQALPQHHRHRPAAEEPPGRDQARHRVLRRVREHPHQQLPDPRHAQRRHQGPLRGRRHAQATSSSPTSRWTTSARRSSSASARG